MCTAGLLDWSYVLAPGACDDVDRQMRGTDMHGNEVVARQGALPLLKDEPCTACPVRSSTPPGARAGC